MDLTIDYDTLIKNNITLSEYVYLKSLYDNENDPKIYQIIDKVEDDSLQSRGYVKVTSEGVVLRQKAINLFEGESLFLKFLNTFPIKTPSGRYLSPLRHTGIAVKSIEKKWNKLFGKDPNLQAKVIKVLEAELNWRRTTGQMEFINQIDAWLNQGNFEKFEYLLQKDKTVEDDLM